MNFQKEIEKLEQEIDIFVTKNTTSTFSSKEYIELNDKLEKFCKDAGQRPNEKNIADKCITLFRKLSDSLPEDE